MEVQSHLQLYSEFKGSLTLMELSQRKKNRLGVGDGGCGGRQKKLSKHNNSRCQGGDSHRMTWQGKVAKSLRFVKLVLWPKQWQIDRWNYRR